MMSGLQPEPHLNPGFVGWVLPSEEPHFCELRIFARIKYLGSDHITIGYIRKFCGYV